ncbi:hypothetical protein TSAR_000700 [Trichomalopsis sarcophagae]|uniref:Uncharacterized protein n=1 Tax=Trichomalopsis sarcophagae TaxID=543379 RepID=A0A232EDL3_9HYME|nr:hypothetical protein TSAR_000700 [Trichomalopsis sarcophagae]
MLPNQQHIQRDDKPSQTIEVSNVVMTRTLNKRKAMSSSQTNITKILIHIVCNTLWIIIGVFVFLLLPRFLFIKSQRTYKRAVTVSTYLLFKTYKFRCIKMLNENVCMWSRSDDAKDIHDKDYSNDMIYISKVIGKVNPY